MSDYSGKIRTIFNRAGAGLGAFVSMDAAVLAGAMTLIGFATANPVILACGLAASAVTLSHAYNSGLALVRPAP